MVNVSYIFDYVGMDGANIVKTWLDQLDPKVKAKLNTRLNILEQISRTEWKMPMTEVLQGDMNGLIAVRVTYQGIAYRLLGFDDPNRGEFTILAYCTEHNNKYIPLNIGRMAIDRRTAVGTNPTIRRTRHDFR